MANEIVVGRLKEDLEKYGSEATAYLGKHIVGQGEEAHLANKILMDLLRPHLLLICGKRGTGKSYFGGVIAEEIALLPEEHRKNLTTVMIDTMGIYWSMKLPNEAQVVLLDEWGLKPIGLKDRVRVYVPFEQKKDYESAGIPVDYGISIPPHLFSAEEWSTAFNLPPTNPLSIGLQKAVNNLKKREEKFSISDLISTIKDDTSLDTHVKSSLESMLTVADSWGVFGDEGIKIDEVMKPGMVNVFDVSRLRSTEAWSVRNLLVALVSKEIYYKRVLARKQEELARVGEIKLKERFPMVWLIIDEAHNFVPSGFETVSTAPILTIVKQGREPGISLVPMTQMPNKIHPEVVSQADMVISHRLTAKSDLDALHATMQTYMMEDVWKYIQSLPKWRGSSIILDDNSERIFQMQTRPRLTWHAGESAIAVNF
jgi:DNA helicase HerA-like ATPase